MPLLCHLHVTTVRPYHLHPFVHLFSCLSNLLYQPAFLVILVLRCICEFTAGRFAKGKKTTTSQSSVTSRHLLRYSHTHTSHKSHTHTSHTYIHTHTHSHTHTHTYTHIHTSHTYTRHTHTHVTHIHTHTHTHTLTHVTHVTHTHTHIHTHTHTHTPDSRLLRACVRAAMKTSARPFSVFPLAAICRMPNAQRYTCADAHMHTCKCTYVRTHTHRQHAYIQDMHKYRTHTWLTHTLALTGVHNVCTA